MEKTTGGQAFPCINPKYDGTYWNKNPIDEGMTLRDYFAAKAITVILGQKDARSKDSQGYAADLAYEIADAMLAARSKT